MTMRFRFALSIIAGIGVLGAATAKDARIGAASLNLPAPTGYCDLTEQQPSDARMIKVVGDLLAGRNELLAMSADCRQLQNWRAGTQPLLDDYAQYQTLIAAKDANLSRADTVKRSCAQIRAEGEKMVAGGTQEVNKRLEAVLKDIKINESRLVGVLAEDADACYFALLQKMKTEAGAEKTQVIMTAVTIIKGKILYYYLYSPYKDAGTVDTALTRHKTNVAAVLKANGG
jgi:hypothetical protein